MTREVTEEALAVLTDGEDGPAIGTATVPVIVSQSEIFAMGSDDPIFIAYGDWRFPDGAFVRAVSESDDPWFFVSYQGTCLFRARCGYKMGAGDGFGWERDTHVTMGRA